MSPTSGADRPISIRHLLRTGHLHKNKESAPEAPSLIPRPDALGVDSMRLAGGPSSNIDTLLPHISPKNHEFIEAVKHRNADKVNRLLSDSDVDSDVFESLLADGANFNMKDIGGNTPLHILCFRGKLNLIEMLLEQGMSPNTKNDAGRTPLANAVFNNHADAIKILLQYRANPNIADEAGITPLAVASADKQSEITKMLLQHQAKGLGPGHLQALPIRSAIAPTKMGPRLPSQIKAGGNWESEISVRTESGPSNTHHASTVEDDIYDVSDEERRRQSQRAKLPPLREAIRQPVAQNPREAGLQQKTAKVEAALQQKKTELRQREFERKEAELEQREAELKRKTTEAEAALQQKETELRQRALQQKEIELKRKTAEAEAALQRKEVETLFNKGKEFHQHDDLEEAIAAYDELLTRSKEATDPALREIRAKTFYARDNALRKLNATRVLSEAKERYNKGRTFGQNGRPIEAIAEYDELVMRFKDASDPALREIVANARLRRNEELCAPQNVDGDLYLADESHPNSSTSASDSTPAPPQANQQVPGDREIPGPSTRPGDDEAAIVLSETEELYDQGNAFRQLGQWEDALEAYDEVIERSKDVDKPEMRELAARARHDRDVTLVALIDGQP
jgi:tetratricopeptide (TPR) repeat protein